MAVQYENGVEIEKISRNELNTVSVNIEDNEYRLSVQSLTDRAGWAEIYIKWIVPGIDQMWLRIYNDDEAPEKERIHAAKLFLEGSDKRECEEFLDKYRMMLVVPPTDRKSVV